jgi:hypothetical protein
MNKKNIFLCYLIFTLVFLISNLQAVGFKITAGDFAQADRFGHSVDISGDIAAVGAYFNNARRGAVYIFQRNENFLNSWTELRKITAEDGQIEDRFGTSLSINNDYIAIGAPNKDDEQGAVYIFNRNQGGMNNWGQLIKLTKNNPQNSDRFGSSLVLKDSVLFIGSEGAVNDQLLNTGVVYIFTKFENSWTLSDSIFAHDGQSGDAFGSSVDFDTDNLVIGAYGADDMGTESGAVYFYTHLDTGWTFITRKIPNQIGQSNFGISVSIDSITAVIGSPNDHNGNFQETGAVYIYTKNDTTWDLQQKVFASDGLHNDDFGFSTALEGAYLFVGASKNTHSEQSNTGASYSFLRTGDQWKERLKVTATDAAADDWFGFSVALHGETGMVGARDADVSELLNAGAAYIFDTVINTNPFAQTDTITTFEDIEILSNLVINDSDSNGDFIFIQSVTEPYNGSITLNDSFNILYIPDSNFFGTDSFTYVLQDSLGASDSGSVIIVVMPVNDAPQITNLPEDIIFERDSTFLVQLEVFDVDTPDSLLIWEFSANNDSLGYNFNPDLMQLEIFSMEGFLGSAILYCTVSDDSMAQDSDSVSISIVYFNKPPVIIGLPQQIMFQADSSAVINLNANDTETPDSLLVWSFSVSNDSLNFDYNQAISQLVLTSEPNFSGQVNLICTVTDDSLASDADTIQVTVTGVTNLGFTYQLIPSKYILSQNYPNPFNPETTIKFGMPSAGYITVKVFNLLGQNVNTLFEGYKEAGYHKIKFNANTLSSGVYFYKLEADNTFIIKKMIVIK